MVGKKRQNGGENVCFGPSLVPKKTTWSRSYLYFRPV